TFRSKKRDKGVLNYASSLALHETPIVTPKSCPKASPASLVIVVHASSIIGAPTFN
ncbi:hypothetical protein Dimus_001101, partial [Dionaea muscipula]